MWDGVSVVIGFILGIILTFFLFWLFYNRRWFFYGACPRGYPACLSANYENDPGQAIKEGANTDDILHLVNGELVYTRVPNTVLCVPDSNTQSVVIERPQWCNFNMTEGAFPGNYQGSNNSFESPKYSFKLPDGENVVVIAERNCVPNLSDPAGVTTGVPIVKWIPYA